jgi:hypothetical protein
VFYETAVSFEDRARLLVISSRSSTFQPYCSKLVATLVITMGSSVNTFEWSVVRASVVPTFILSHSRVPSRILTFTPLVLFHFSIRSFILSQSVLPVKRSMCSRKLLVNLVQCTASSFAPSILEKPHAPRVQATRTTGTILTISPKPAYSGAMRTFRNAPAANETAKRL